MTSDGDALFRAVCENPADETPRLVYADWLEENGHAERAEFIRLQCEKWNLCPAYPDVTAARTRASDLSREFGEAWYAELPVIAGVEWSDLFVRGFVDAAWVEPARDVPAQLAALFAATPLQHLTLIEFGAKNLALLLDMPEVGRLVRVKRQGSGSGYSAGVGKLIEAARRRFPKTEFP